MLIKILCFTVLFEYISCARILGVFYVPSISHQLAYQPLWKELAHRGHEVTVMTPNPLKENITNLKEIDVGYTYKTMREGDITKHMSKEVAPINSILFWFNFSQKLIEEQFAHPEMQKIMFGNESQFDIIIFECLCPLIHSIGAKFRIPMVGVLSTSTFLNTYDAVGNPTHPVHSPDIFLNILGEPTFFERMHSFLFNIYYRLVYHWYVLPKYDKAARKYFGDDIPYLGDIERNMSMLLLNVNPLTAPVRPNVPAVVEISQMHIRPRKPLPDDLKKLLDDSTQGVVYFSLGSNVKSANLTLSVRQVIIDALSELPYQVLWKWEEDVLPGQPKNVIIRKWLPQQDLLGHPNIKVFVTQGGLQSIEESIMGNVPMVGMPFFVDQPLNVMKIVERGLAQYVDYTTMTKNELKRAIIEVATNRKYKGNVIKARAILTDQPMLGPKKAAWWIEYVLRHNGAKHLRSPAIDMPYYKYFCLDVIGFLLCVLYVFMYCIRVGIRIWFMTSEKKQKTS